MLYPTLVTLLVYFALYRPPLVNATRHDEHIPARIGTNRPFTIYVMVLLACQRTKNSKVRSSCISQGTLAKLLAERITVLRYLQKDSFDSLSLLAMYRAVEPITTADHVSTVPGLRPFDLFSFRTAFE